MRNLPSYVFWLRRHQRVRADPGAVRIPHAVAGHGGAGVLGGVLELAANWSSAYYPRAEDGGGVGTLAVMADSRRWPRR